MLGTPLSMTYYSKQKHKLLPQIWWEHISNRFDKVEHLNLHEGRIYCRAAVVRGITFILAYLINWHVRPLLRVHSHSLKKVVILNRMFRPIKLCDANPTVVQLLSGQGRMKNMCSASLGLFQPKSYKLKYNRCLSRCISITLLECECKHLRGCIWWWLQSLTGRGQEYSKV